MPKGVALRSLLKQTGPLVAPSANPEGEMPARTIREAKKYFGNRVDFYVDSGMQKGAASTIIQILQ
ncbi:MAG: Sua5/YciO/YrdC/YwlC family protein [Patescibacteria group bacterium]